ncbi:head-tail connector protein [Apilactobacillus micheneri]|uniref:head-tail connector protein n=1 Tax=Apilactobacillus micheneri TaxID=1899430 RepID=UPI001129AB9B|nr:head-tail connector protein [Apilactobacillus micheneri]TPR49849.1 hypothetical protein DY126_07520 [Apilactobacillus micheneri]
MYFDNLVSKVKNAVKIPKEYTDEDTYINNLVKSAKLYVDNALDCIPDGNNDLYIFIIVQIAIFNYLNIDSNKATEYPIYITNAINQLKYI